MGLLGKKSTKKIRNLGKKVGTESRAMGKKFVQTAPEMLVKTGAAAQVAGKITGDVGKAVMLANPEAGVALMGAGEALSVAGQGTKGVGRVSKQLRSGDLARAGRTAQREGVSFASGVQTYDKNQAKRQKSLEKQA